MPNGKGSEKEIKGNKGGKNSSKGISKVRKGRSSGAKEEVILIPKGPKGPVILKFHR